MWNRPFGRLRWRLTRNYTLIFGLLILGVVAIAYTIIWRSLLYHERQLLIGTVYHEAEEYVHSGELPVSEVKLQTSEMLAYMVTADEKETVLDQLTAVPVGRALLAKRSEWPERPEATELIFLRDADGERRRYLAGMTEVREGDELKGHLYMFKDMKFYYEAFFHTLYLLLCAVLVLLASACLFGYFLAGKEIKPLQALYARQKQFTADASHEMRTPLSVMLLAVSGLQNEKACKQSPFIKETLQILGAEVRRLTRLTDSLMELARQDLSEQKPEHVKLELSKLLQKVCERLQLLSDSKKIKLRTEIEPGIFVVGDDNELSRLLIILADNALKYSPAESEVTISLSKSKNTITLAVADHGPGIADEEKVKIFDRFYQVDKARTASCGLGLGLSLAKGIVERHGGSIEALDNEPRGTVMRVLLPG